MAAAERITFADFQERFKTEEQCREYLFRQRFPNGFVCPSCGAKEYYPIYRRNLCQCKKCRKQTTKIMVSGGYSPTMDCSDTGCYQNWGGITAAGINTPRTAPRS